MKRKTKCGISRKWFLAAALLPMGWPGIAAADEAWPLTLHQHMRRAFDVSYGISQISEPMCRTKGAVVGVSVDFIEAYESGDSQRIACLVETSEHPQIVAFAAGSPAQDAALSPGDDLIAIKGPSTLALFAVASPKASFPDELDQKLVQQNSAVFSKTVRRPGCTVRQAQIMPCRGCATRIVIEMEVGITACSDDTYIAISSKLTVFTRNDDELALIVGHGLGHIIDFINAEWGPRDLHERCDIGGRADARGVALVKCVGHDFDSPLQFWIRRDAQGCPRMPRSPIHGRRKKGIE